MVFCRNGPATMVNAFVGQLDPTAKYQLRKFRSSPDDSCEEEIVLKKWRERLPRTYSSIIF